MCIVFYIYIYIYIYIIYIYRFGLVSWIFSFLKSSSEDIQVFPIVFLLQGQLVKKEPYICPSAFDHFPGHLWRIVLDHLTSNIVESARANIGFFFYQLVQYPC